MTRFALPFVLAVLLPAGAALADDDDCRVPAEQWQPREAVMTLAQTNGWTDISVEIDDGCYEVEGRDGDGRRFEAKLDPATLRLIEMERRSGHHNDDHHDDDDDHGRNARDAAPAGSVAPPSNGLFGNGEPPRVQVN